ARSPTSSWSKRAKAVAPISFWEYLRLGLPMTALTLAFGFVWLWVDGLSAADGGCQMIRCTPSQVLELVKCYGRQCACRCSFQNLRGAGSRVLPSSRIRVRDRSWHPICCPAPRTRCTNEYVNARDSRGRGDIGVVDALSLRHSRISLSGELPMRQTLLLKILLIAVLVTTASPAHAVLNLTNIEVQGELFNGASPT